MKGPRSGPLKDRERAIIWVCEGPSKDHDYVLLPSARLGRDPHPVEGHDGGLLPEDLDDRGAAVRRAQVEVRGRGVQSWHRRSDQGLARTMKGPRSGPARDHERTRKGPCSGSGTGLERTTIGTASECAARSCAGPRGPLCRVQTVERREDVRWWREVVTRLCSPTRSRRALVGVRRVVARMHGFSGSMHGWTHGLLPRDFNDLDLEKTSLCICASIFPKDTQRKMDVPRSASMGKFRVLGRTGAHDLPRSPDIVEIARQSAVRRAV